MVRVVDHREAHRRRPRLRQRPQAKAQSHGRRAREVEDDAAQIEALVDAAENGDLSVQSPALEQWLWQLKDAVEDADNLFDEMSHRTIEQESAASRSKWYALPFSKRTAASGPILERLSEVMKRFDDLASKVGAFAHIVGSLRDGRAARRAQRRFEIEGGRETGSLLAAGEVLGRDNEQMELVLRLTGPAVCEDGSNCRGISVVSVLGIGGVGKTTLAQLIFDDREVEGFFDLKMWVYVSNAFEVPRILKMNKKLRPSIRYKGISRRC